MQIFANNFNFIVFKVKTSNLSMSGKRVANNYFFCVTFELKSDVFQIQYKLGYVFQHTPNIVKLVSYTFDLYSRWSRTDA